MALENSWKFVVQGEGGVFVFPLMTWKLLTMEDGGRYMIQGDCSRSKGTAHMTALDSKVHPDISL